jgi:hypothetical protein
MRSAPSTLGHAPHQRCVSKVLNDPKLTGVSANKRLPLCSKSHSSMANLPPARVRGLKTAEELEQLTAAHGSHHPRRLLLGWHPFLRCEVIDQAWQLLAEP